MGDFTREALKNAGGRIAEIKAAAMSKMKGNFMKSTGEEDKEVDKIEDVMQALIACKKEKMGELEALYKNICSEPCQPNVDPFDKSLIHSCSCESLKMIHANYSNSIECCSPSAGSDVCERLSAETGETELIDTIITGARDVLPDCISDAKKTRTEKEEL